MKGLRGALGFLTILPVGKEPAWQGTAMLPWFPVVGLILGGIWMGCDAVLGWIFPLGMRAVLDMVVLIVLTGGLHLDGLADTADGLLSHRERDEALKIMKDSHIGTWGVLAVLAVVGLKVSALHEILLRRNSLLLVLIPAYGRVAMLMGMGFLPYGRGEEGIAHVLFQDKRRHAWLPGLILLGLCSCVLLDWPGPLAINGAFVGTAAAIMAWYRSRTGCITGDMLGALGEAVETLLLVLLAAGPWHAGV